MAFTNVREAQYEVKQFALPDGSSLVELQERITKLNVDDAVAVQREVKRCNKRCNGNDVNVSVRATALNSRDDGQTEEQVLSVKFQIVDKAV